MSSELDNVVLIFKKWLEPMNYSKRIFIYFLKS